MKNNSLAAPPVRLADLLSGLPAEWSRDPFPAVQAAARTSGKKVVVLDDDPTGTQTVHDVPVLTGWSVDILCREMANDSPALYLLTNSRSLPLSEARALNREIGRNLAAAAGETGCQFVVVSRSDSTLRGHFPGEVDALAQALGDAFDAWLLIPFFDAGGRYTIEDIHYVAEGEWLIPAGQTDFARDPAFGYRASNLRQWVEEKTAGRIPAADVASVSLREIRQGGPDYVRERLLSLSRGVVCVVNAASSHDLATFTAGLLMAEARGKRFLYRTAASFVPVRAGISPRPLLTGEELARPARGAGVTIVGSHVPTTTRQLASLLAMPAATGLELDVRALLDDHRHEEEIRRVAAQVNDLLRHEKAPVVFTTRSVEASRDAESSLAIARSVSHGLVSLVRAITVRPRYILAKGGITASDIACHGLDVERALVKGQVLPGVPLWKLGPESRYPGLDYVVFPGNVGDEQALATVFRTLEADR